jgi:hypothetical protein
MSCTPTYGKKETRMQRKEGSAKGRRRGEHKRKVEGKLKKERN